MRFSTFAVSLGLTLLFELPFAYLWGLRSRRDLKLAVLVNVLTNPMVVLCSLLLRQFLGWPWWLAQPPLEVLAILVEGLCYYRCGESVRHPYKLALCANVFSYSIGLVLNRVF